jgi:PAS domain S-box-containing protein
MGVTRRTLVGRRVKVGRGSILVVDDDQTLTSALGTLFGDAGYAVTVFPSGRAAIKALRAVRPWVVLLDPHLPDLDGLEVMQQAQRLPQAPDIVVATGSATPESTLVAAEMGAAAYLVKPFDLARLAELVGRLCDKRRRVRESDQQPVAREQQPDEIEVVLDIAKALGSTHELASVLKDIARRTAQVMGAERCSISLFKEGGILSVVSEFAGGHVGPARPGKLEGLAGKDIGEAPALRLVIERRSPVTIDDVATSDLAPDSWRRVLKMKSVLLIPLLRSDEVIGILSLDTVTARRRFADRDIRLATTIASHLTLAIDNVEFFRRADEERRRLEVLYDISRRLAAVHDTDQILTLIVNEAERLLGVEAAGIRLLEGEDLVVRARTESAAAIMSRPRLKVGESLTGQVVAQGRPITVEDLVTDTRYDPAHKRGALALGFHGFLGVPLQVQGTVIGALNIYSRGRRRFTPDEISLLSACADQAAIAIENARLYDASRAQVSRMRRLAELSQLVTSSLDFQKVMDVVTQSVLDLLQADLVRLWVVDEAGGVLRMAAYKTRDAADMVEGGATPIPLGRGVLGWVVEHRSKRYSPNLAEEVLMVNRSWVIQHGYVAHLAVPLIVGDRAVGALSMMTKTARRFTPDEEELLETFAAKAATAIENARLHGETVRRSQQLDALLSAARAVMGGLDLQRVLERIIEEAARIARTPHVKVLLVDKAAGVLRVDAVSGAQLPSGYELPLDASYAGTVATTGEPLFVADIQDDPRNPIAQRDRELGICTFLGLPIRKGDEVLGVLAFNTTEPRTYGPEELTFLASFADQAAVAIDNARLYASLERRLGRVRTLSRLNQLVSSSLDMDEVLREITLAAAHLMEATLASFWVADETRRTLELLAFSDPMLGADLPVKRITFAEGALGWVATNRQTANIPDVAADHRVLSQDWWKKRGLHSYLAVPVIFEGSLYAVLALYGRRPFRIELDDRDLIDGFVAQAAVAIRNARLFAESERRRSIAEALADVGRALAQSLDVAVISERIAESLRGLLRAGSSAVYRLDAKSGDLVVMAGTGMLATTLEPNTALPAGSVAHLAVTQRRPIATSDVLDDPQLAITADARARLKPDAHRSALAVPLLVHETVIGALGIGDVEGRLFDDEELRLTQAFADQAAIALENARLYEEAHAQRKQLTQIFDSTTDGIMFVRPDGRIEAANRRAAELLGIEDDAVVGADLIGLLVRQAAAAEADDLFAASLRSLFNDVGGGEGDLTIAALTRVLHWVAKPTRDAAGDVVGLTLTLQDVTKEREVSQMKSDFVSFVTHQLRTPLSGIKWMLELAGQQEHIPADTLTYIEDAHGAAERLITLVNDLLDISRLERGRLDVRPRPTDLAALTGEVLAEVRRLAQDKGHRVSVSAPADLPPVLADPQLMRQVILNLASNAIKYTRPGGELAVRMSREVSSVLWAIQDNGIGIPKEAQRRLFEKFYRADNVYTIETEGTGLGLYLVRLIVERFGGRVWCESEEGQGATFLFTLPQAESH